MDCFIKTKYNILFSDRIKQYNGAVLCFEGTHVQNITVVDGFLKDNKKLCWMNMSPNSHWGFEKNINLAWFTGVNEWTEQHRNSSWLVQWVGVALQSTQEKISQAWQRPLSIQDTQARRILKEQRRLIWMSIVD